MMMEQFRSYLAAATSQGNEFIERGEFHSALRSYRCALDEMKIAIAQLGSSYDSCILKQPLSSPLLTSSSSQPVSQMRFAQLGRLPLSCFDAQHLYQIPLELPEGLYSYDQACFVVLYNLALSYHLSAASCKATSAKMARSLSKTALDLWEIVYRLHDRTDLGVKKVHVCAILNNLGQLHSAHGNAKRTRQCFTKLLCAMNTLQGSCDPEFLTGYETFLNSVLSLVFDLRSTTAAAA